MIELIYSDQVTPQLSEDLIRFCEQAEIEKKHAAAANMSTDWENSPNTLLYLLHTEKRFSQDKGGLCIYREGEGQKIIAVSGFYQSHFCESIFVLGVRSWVLKGHRFQLTIAHKLIPIQIREVRALGAKQVILSFNDSTKAFYDLIIRANNSKTKMFFFNEKYPETYLNFYPIEFPVKINNTRQWVLVIDLDSDFHFDWRTIQWKET
jgi:hypothetical protein